MLRRPVARSFNDSEWEATCDGSLDKTFKRQFAAIWVGSRPGAGGPARASLELGYGTRAASARLQVRPTVTRTGPESRRGRRWAWTAAFKWPSSPGQLGAHGPCGQPGRTQGSLRSRKFKLSLKAPNRDSKPPHW